MAHPDFLSLERGDGAQFELSFDDLAAHTFEDLVTLTVEVVRRVPGVASAYREDRELITIEGSFDAQALETEVRAWWVDRLQDELPT